MEHYYGRTKYKSSLKEYIKRRLGAPVLEINVDDDQFDDRIDEHSSILESITMMVQSEHI